MADDPDADPDVDPDEDTELIWQDAIIPHERRIQLVPMRVTEGGRVVNNTGGLNMQFDEDEFDEAVEAWIEWLEQACENLDFYRNEYSE